MRPIKIILLVLAAGCLYGAYVFASEAYLGHGPAIEPTPITVTSGMNADDVAVLLASKGIIPSAARYRLFGIIERSVTRPKAGDYELRAGTPYVQIARLIALGPARREVQLTLIEGWSVNDEIEYLASEEKIPAADTARLTGSSVNRARFESGLRDAYAFLKDLPTERSLEGYLFPNTYRVWADQLPDSLISKQLDEFKKRFGDAKPTSVSRPLETLDDVIILASIVQDEVRSEADMRLVAGIFLNRLRDGMALQSDATLNYLTGSGRTRSTAKDLSIDSPWNTYKYPGLPVSPIGNPGEAAIRAVLNPETTDYRYFLTDKDGKTYYAKTLEEHVENRRKAGF